MFSGDCEDLLKLPSHAVVVNRVDQVWPVAGVKQLWYRPETFSDEATVIHKT